MHWPLVVYGMSLTAQSQTRISERQRLRSKAIPNSSAVPCKKDRSLA
jgi:hypothetical protein